MKNTVRILISVWFAVSLILGSCVTAFAGEEGVRILVQGHASLRITTPEGKVIYIDPNKGKGYDVPADLILITHGHSDHTAVSRIKHKNQGCETITWKEALKGGTHQSFDLGWVRIEAVEAGNNKNHSIKKCVGYILTFSNEKTLYVSGDTSRTRQMEALADRHLDCAFFCCDGTYNMNLKEAIECAGIVGARVSISYHPTVDEAPKNRDKLPEGWLPVAAGEEFTLE